MPALRRAWTTDGVTDESARESQTVIERILGLSLHLQAIATAVVEAAGDVTSGDVPPGERAAAPPAATCW
jgi:hypothetical protein